MRFKAGQIISDDKNNLGIILNVSLVGVKYYLFYAPTEPYFLGRTFTEGFEMMRYCYRIYDENTTNR